MKFEPLNTEQHDLGKVSELIYETELEIFRSILGKNETEAVKNIESLIRVGDNLFGSENIHMVSDGDHEVLGILVSFRGDEISFWKDLKAYAKILDFSGLLGYLFKGTLINELLTARVGGEDYYISNIAVDPEFRGQGIGTCIVENALKLAKNSGCRKVILNVTLNNEKALKLYERFGFKVNGINTADWIFKGQGTFDMEFLI